VILKRTSSNLDLIRDIKGTFTQYDIDNTSIENIFEKEKKIDIIIHCATNYGRKNENLINIIESNVLFPLEILDVGSKKGTNIFINTDTSFSKLKEHQGYMQNYVVSKKHFLDWGKIYSSDNKMSFINLRLEHIYGPGDDSSKFIGFLLKSFKENVEYIDLTFGEQYRDFIYIDDVVSAFLKVISIRDDLSGFNDFEVGTGEAVKVKDLVILIKKMTKSKTLLNFGSLKYRANEVIYSKADNSKLLKLGWEPKYNLKSGIAESIKNFQY